MTTVIVSAITVYQYKWAVSRVLIAKLYESKIHGRGDTHFASKDAPLELTDQENTTVAISSLVVIFSIFEVALAVCAAWISDSFFQPLQENQFSQVCEVIQLLGTREHSAN